jgi:hypothetical protein
MATDSENKNKITKFEKKTRVKSQAKAITSMITLPVFFI